MRLFRRRGSDSAPQLVSLSPLRREEGGDPEDPAAPPLIKPSIIYISADEQHRKGEELLREIHQTLTTAFLVWLIYVDEWREST